jgi:hypothetical protein
VITGNCLFGLFFGNLIGLGGDEGDEFHAALYEEISGLLCKGHSALRWKNLTYNLLNSCCE